MCLVIKSEFVFCMHTTASETPQTHSRSKPYRSHSGSLWGMGLPQGSLRGFPIKMSKSCKGFTHSTVIYPPTVRNSELNHHIYQQKYFHMQAPGMTSYQMGVSGLMWTYLGVLDKKRFRNPKMSLKNIFLMEWKGI